VWPPFEIEESPLPGNEEQEPKTPAEDHGVPEATSPFFLPVERPLQDFVLIPEETPAGIALSFQGQDPDACLGDVLRALRAGACFDLDINTAGSGLEIRCQVQVGGMVFRMSSGSDLPDFVVVSPISNPNEEAGKMNRGQPIWGWVEWLRGTLSTKSEK